MQRKVLYLAASIAELLRFLALFFIADSLGVLMMDGGIPALLRYAAAPQLLFAAGLFFLWYDPERYGAYRPLLLVGKAIGLLVLAPFAFRLVASGLAEIRDFALIGLIALVDLLVLLLLALRPRAARAVPAAEETGPRGPEDIEKVEG